MIEGVHLSHMGTDGSCRWTSATRVERTTTGTQRGPTPATARAAPPAALYEFLPRSRFHCLLSNHPAKLEVSRSGRLPRSRGHGGDDGTRTEAIWATPAGPGAFEVCRWSISSWRPPDPSSLMLTARLPPRADTAWSTDTAHGPLSHLPLCQGPSRTLWNCQVRRHPRGSKRLVAQMLSGWSEGKFNQCYTEKTKCCF